MPKYTNPIVSRTSYYHHNMFVRIEGEGPDTFQIVQLNIVNLTFNLRYVVSATKKISGIYPWGVELTDLVDLNGNKVFRKQLGECDICKSFMLDSEGYYTSDLGTKDSMICVSCYLKKDSDAHFDTVEIKKFLESKKIKPLLDPENENLCKNFNRMAFAL